MLAAAFHKLFSPNPPYPPEHQRNFRLLFLDIAFFGVVNGTILSFLGIYIARLGGSPVEIGILSASPAIINILFSIPSSVYGRGKSSHQVTRWAWLFTRLFYLLLIPLPLLFTAKTQIWTIMAITLLMNIPATLAAVMGNTFFAETVPLRFRGSVVSTRNALMAAASMISSLSVGLLSRVFPLEQQYTIVFAIGFIGGMLSVLSIFLIRPIDDIEEPRLPHMTGDALRNPLRPDILKGVFLRVLLILFIYHVAMFWVNPLFPLYQTRALRMDDLLISQGTSTFWIVYFLTSTQTGALGRRWGFQKLLGYGALVISVSLLIFVFSYQQWIYLAGQVINGIGWAWIGGGLINYLLENVPANDRPAHMAWFNIAVNIAMLISGLVVPRTIEFTGLFGGMLLSVGLRFAATFVILFLGDPKRSRHKPTLDVERLPT